MNTESLRLFFAVETPDDVKKEFSAISKSFGSLWRPVSPHQLHITLAFMGEVPEAQLNRVLDAGNSAAAVFSSFDLELKDIGYFPDNKRPGILFSHVHSDGTLSLLAENLSRSLSDLADKKSFKPHLTIARNRDRAGNQLNLSFKASWHVNSFVLFKSTFQQSSVRHDIVKRFELK
ncbi:MAG: RNA 2',3'-cyclic phosphodiesterase [Candidatus Riflebacteria bacterium]|nr:RNA 2',3'-cyclic phosphodiesterase [Candidatus Riflebacteria bacterium]